MTRPRPEREALWLEVERELRRFVRECEAEPEWMLPAPLAAFVRAVRPRLAQLDAAGRTPPATGAEARAAQKREGR